MDVLETYENLLSATHVHVTQREAAILTLAQVLESKARGRDNGERLETVLTLMQEDPHQYGPRQCQTCRLITGLVGKPFGCVKYNADREKRLASQKS